MILKSADIVDNYSLALTFEVRDDLSDPEVLQMFITNYSSKTMAKTTFTPTPLGENKAANTRTVKLSFLLPTKYSDYVNVGALLYLASGKAKSSNNLNYQTIASDFYSALSMTPQLFNMSDGKATLVSGNSSVAEVNDALTKYFAFLGLSPSTFSLKNNDSMNKYDIEYDNTGSVLFFNLYPMPRDLRVVMGQFLGNLGL